MDGEREFIRPNGDTYKCLFKDDNKHGFGIYKSIERNEYKGEFIYDKHDGFGNYKWKNGRECEGSGKR